MSSVSAHTPDYAIIDFRLITNQWTGLLAVGDALKISSPTALSSNCSFSSNLADDPPNGDDHGSTTGEGGGDTRSTSSFLWCGPPTPSFCRRMNFPDRTG